MKSKFSKLKEKADDLCSEYIRKRDCSICYTCGKLMTYRESQNGHFITRGCLELRFDDKNCHCQCYRCNIALKGNYIVYTLNMIRDYGKKLVDKYQAIKDRKSNIKYTTLDYERIIEKFKQKIKNLNYEV